MLLHKFVQQPDSGQYRRLLTAATATAQFDRLDVAMAYARTTGVAAILPDLESLETRWLVGIDWCRTEPVALEQLAVVPKSTVRVPGGLATVYRAGCTPTRSFHPKTFILRGTNAIAVITGSGNLSRNGLTTGDEHGSLLLVADASTPDERALSNSCLGMADWFDGAWRKATLLSKIIDQYRIQYAAMKDSPAITEDDAADTAVTGRARPRAALNPKQLRQLRAARCFWIEAGTLSANRGPGVPGNQLMLKALMRVFFGFPARDLARDTRIGAISIRYKGELRNDRTLRYSNNSMDVLTMPVPADGGPDSYDGRIVHFEKHPETSGLIFEMQVLEPSELGKLQRRSMGTSYALSSGRKWGVY